MKLTVLTENFAGGRFLAEHGLSYLIEIDGKTILFDTGASDVFVKNAARLNIDIQSKTDLVVLSHGHWDHGDGLRFINHKPLLIHPAAFMKRFGKSDGRKVGLFLSEEKIRETFQVTTSTAPVKITERLIFLGEIPRLNDFESQTTAFADEHGADDFVPDDSALAVIENGKLMVVSGCAHSGICNICEYAKQVTGIETIQAVIGGFHLLKNDEQTRRTIQYFQKEKIQQLHPSHCTGLPALAAFYEAFAIRQLKTGDILQF